jgi:hypothetical protein
MSKRIVTRMGDDEDDIWHGPHKPDKEDFIYRYGDRDGWLIHQPEASIPPGTIMVQDSGGVSILYTHWAYSCCIRLSTKGMEDSSEGLGAGVGGIICLMLTRTTQRRLQPTVCLADGRRTG